MEAFTRHTGIVAVLDRANVDTDAIIPKQFLKSIKRTGFGPNLFFDWRYGSDGKPDPAFFLNQPPFDEASILVGRNNFGCGSSREHAVWAILQDGFRVVIAPARGTGEDRVPGFADIFRNNSGKCGLLTIELSEEQVEEIFQAVQATPGTRITADLEQQVLTLYGDPDRTFPFEVNEGVRKKLLLGLDDIGQSLEHEAAITVFEKQHPTYRSA